MTCLFTSSLIKGRSSILADGGNADDVGDTSFSLTSFAFAENLNELLLRGPGFERVVRQTEMGAASL